VLDDDLAMRVLRFHGHCPFGKNEDGKTVFLSALIAVFQPICNDDDARQPPAIHRIGLNPDASKFGKMMLGPVTGCAIKLDSDEDVEQSLGVCEGVETAIAIRATSWRPIWALGSASAIRTLDPIPGIETLTIFADHDDVGVAAARECAQRWADAGREAFVRMRAVAGKDFADA